MGICLESYRCWFVQETEQRHAAIGKSGPQVPPPCRRALAERLLGVLGSQAHWALQTRKRTCSSWGQSALQQRAAPSTNREIAEVIQQSTS